MNMRIKAIGTLLFFLTFISSNAAGAVIPEWEEPAYKECYGQCSNTLVKACEMNKWTAPEEDK